MASLRAIENALEDGEDELARRILQQVRVRPLTERELEIVAVFERILTGRDLVKQLDVSLESVELEDARQRLSLRLRQDTGRTLTLKLPPADLEHLMVGVDGSGLEDRRFDSRLIDALSELEVASGQAVEIELTRYTTPIGRSLAMRELWRLSLRSGEIVQGGEAYPASRLPRPRFERVLRSEEVASLSTDPEDLIRAMRGQDTTKGELMRLAVGVTDERRTETLRVLLPEIEHMARTDPERVIAAAPALRWIARTAEPGADPRAWVLWLRAWDEHEQALEYEGEEDSNLDLPNQGRRPAGRKARSDSNLDLP